MSEVSIMPHYGETVARFEIGARVWSTLYNMYMIVEARAHAAGVWAYCLVSQVDSTKECFTSGLSHQLRQDCLSDWHRDAEVWATRPMELPDGCDPFLREQEM